MTDRELYRYALAGIIVQAEAEKERLAVAADKNTTRLDKLNADYIEIYNKLENLKN